MFLPLPLSKCHHLITLWQCKRCLGSLPPAHSGSRSAVQCRVPEYGLHYFTIVASRQAFLSLKGHFAKTQLLLAPNMARRTTEPLYRYFLLSMQPEKARDGAANMSKKHQKVTGGCSGFYPSSRLSYSSRRVLCKACPIHTCPSATQVPLDMAGTGVWCGDVPQGGALSPAQGTLPGAYCHGDTARERCPGIPTNRCTVGFDPAPSVLHHFHPL